VRGDNEADEETTISMKISVKENEICAAGDSGKWRRRKIWKTSMQMTVFACCANTTKTFCEEVATLYHPHIFLF